MSFGWTFVMIGIVSVFWPLIVFVAWCSANPEEGDFELWAMSLSIEQIFFYRALNVGGIALVFIGFALVAVT